MYNPFSPGLQLDFHPYKFFLLAFHEEQLFLQVTGECPDAYFPFFQTLSLSSLIRLTV